ncbi:Holliday junction branch migration protein RuvA [Desulfovibrio legallii]|uniref:Holliday junction branch migration complex subunit RuvA n=1 Tax=Desulfovibrio legallii TaxID=571438 RepID=A0A6H3FBN6_9BACT|nr:Holliday junction branch migration protein RuvA [Desulfovibrio legallii]RHH26121.1 Holliday junction branch migration protein RuvA [Desulfovibrio sp. AM18-2]CAI3223854.1 Holliday junction ATP-dependent DNA helicase RuvA (EC [Desulfovibrio diazotrophicus]VVU42738.1 Holliday junction ATP-dependent DNA helicase RuvA (EC [Desulfovibrio diazotrophicus]
MIAYVEGRLAQVWGNTALVVTQGGVGYAVGLPAHTLASLPGRGEAVAFYTSLAVREDALELFGFASFEERQTFEVLVSISKVGARTALGILSIFRPDDLRRLVLEDDVLALTRVSGIGKKTAEHIFLELKYKLKVDDAPQAAALVGSGVRPGSVFRDVLDGLGNLGYSEDACAPMVKKILLEEPDLDVTGALRAALKTLAKGKV